MWGARYWGVRYWGARMWGKIGAEPPEPTNYYDFVVPSEPRTYVVNEV